MSHDLAATESSLDFFNRIMGQHLVSQTGNALADAQRALSGGHKMAKGGAQQRIASGWAVVSDQGAVLQFKLAAKGITYSDSTRFDAWLDCLEKFDGGPVMLIEFDKKPVPVGNLARTFDLRHVVICGPKGMEVFDWTQAPDPINGSRCHKILWRLKAEREKAGSLPAVTTAAAQ